MAAPPFRSGSVNTGDGSNFWVDLNKPTGLANNDLLVVTVISAKFGGTSFSAPSGWTLIEGPVVIGNLTFSCYIKAITNVGGEPATYRFSTPDTALIKGLIAAYIGAAVDVDGNTNGAAGSTVNAPSVTTTAADETILRVFNTSNSTALSTPSGTTLRLSNTDAVSGSFILVDATQVSAGASGSSSSTMGSASSNNVGYTLALKLNLTNVSISRTLKWNTKVTITTSRILKWNTKGTITAARILKWNTKGTVTASRILKWNTRIQVSISRTLKWNTKLGALISRTLKWNTKQTITSSRILLWNTRTQVTPINRTLLWNTRIQVSTSRTLLWLTKQTITASRTLKWSTYKGILVLRTLLWNIRNQVIIQRILQWTVYRGWTAIEKPLEDWTELPKDDQMWTELDHASSSWR